MCSALSSGAAVLYRKCASSSSAHLLAHSLNDLSDSQQLSRVQFSYRSLCSLGQIYL
jgi:hypothetical protein